MNEPLTNGHDPEQIKREARNARARQKYAEHPEKIKARNVQRAAYKAQWHQANKERLRAQRNAYDSEWKKKKRITDPSYRLKESQRHKKIYQENKEVIKARVKAYYERTRPEQLIAQRQYYQQHKNDRDWNRWSREHPDEVRQLKWEWLQRNRNLVRDRVLRKNFDMTGEDYFALLAEQNGVCAICREPENRSNKKTGVEHMLSVDHDHETGQIRGLLCHGCNAALGFLNDNPIAAFNLWQYLIAHGNHNE
jgi:hypothetical protein